MKAHLHTRGHSRLLILSAVVLTTFAARIAAQRYTIDWFAIDGGGGTDTLSGTVGQPDTGDDLLGGNFAITSAVSPQHDPLRQSVLVAVSPTTFTSLLAVGDGDASSFVTSRSKMV